MTKIVYRQMPAPRELSQQIPAPWAKAGMQKPQGGSKFLVQIPGGARGGWLWMKLIPALCKQSTPGLHKVEHGITKREATPPFPSKFYTSQIIEWYLQTG